MVKKRATYGLYWISRRVKSFKRRVEICRKDIYSAFWSRDIVEEDTSMTYHSHGSLGSSIYLD